MRVTVTSKGFESSHFAKPKGRGGWAFEFTYYDRAGTAGFPDLQFAPGSLTYAEAKKWARKFAVAHRPEGAVECVADCQP